jgi:AcrR family transcriptional regulator
MPMDSPPTQKKAGKTTTRLKKSERKKQILLHAKQLFVTLGYHETTTDKIARAAGVSEPVLYRHFDSKKALFLEVLHEIREATIDRWQAASARLTNSLERLHAIFDAYLGSTREHALEFRIMHRTLVETNDEEVTSCLRSFYLDSEQLLAKVIAEGQRAGVFRKSLDPRVAAWELIRTALGYTLTLPLGIPLYNETDYLRQAIDFVLHSLTM